MTITWDEYTKIHGQATNVINITNSAEMYDRASLAIENINKKTIQPWQSNTSHNIDQLKVK